MMSECSAQRSTRRRGSTSHGPHRVPATADVVASGSSAVYTCVGRPASARETAVVRPVTPAPMTRIGRPGSIKPRPVGGRPRGRAQAGSPRRTRYCWHGAAGGRAAARHRRCGPTARSRAWQGQVARWRTPARSRHGRRPQRTARDSCGSRPGMQGRLTRVQPGRRHRHWWRSPLTARAGAHPRSRITSSLESGLPSEPVGIDDALCRGRAGPAAQRSTTASAGIPSSPSRPSTPLAVARGVPAAPTVGAKTRPARSNAGKPSVRAGPC